MGAIAVETRTIERIVPADPANASSQEQKIMEAGQVSTPSRQRLVRVLTSVLRRSGTPTPPTRLLRPSSTLTARVSP